MKRSTLLVALTLMSLALGFAAPTSAMPITSFTATILSTDPTQLGRLSRNGVPQDWSGGETYPGWINATTTFHYSAYTIPAWMFDFGPGQYAGFVQVDIDSPYATTFAAAYLNSYNPLNQNPGPGTWLGDDGASGNPFGNPSFFQVFLPQGSDLVLVLSETTANGGLGLPANFFVEGFVDTAYTDPVPEPASLLLLGTGLVGLRAAFRKRRK